MKPAAQLLAASGLSRVESRLLLASVLGRPIEALIAHPDQPIDDDLVTRFAGLAARRTDGEPIAYLVGEKEFYGRPFTISPAVLIPRPETELLVQVALARLRDAPAPTVLDLGTGSGCIAITLALECPAAKMTAVDRSTEALDIARTNAQGLGARIEFIVGNWYSNVGGIFDAIVANPPYVAVGDEHLQALRYEPRAALISGLDGLADLRQIVAGAPAQLCSGGWLAVEHGYEQAAAVRELFATAGFFAIETHRDAAGNERVCIGTVERAAGVQSR